MQKKQKIYLGGLLVFLTIGYMVWSSMQSEVMYYVTIPELLAKTPQVYGQGIRLTGRILDGSIEYDTRSMQLNFVLTDGKNKIPVTYKGVVPDTFKYGVEVVVEGKLLPDHSFQAAKLMTKCPSKYEPEE